MNKADKHAEYRIRRIRPEDNPTVAQIIRQVMTEFGAVGCGFSIEDSEVDSMYEAYSTSGSVFYVIERNDRLLGCGGIAPLTGGEPGVCELRKMYFLQELRGSGLGSRLLEILIKGARDAGYASCYLETMDTMSRARQLYLKHGFQPIEKPLGNTGHGSCNCFMAMGL